jgi:hypothetical protein
MTDVNTQKLKSMWTKKHAKIHLLVVVTRAFASVDTHISVLCPCEGQRQATRLSQTANVPVHESKLALFSSGWNLSADWNMKEVRKEGRTA